MYGINNIKPETMTTVEQTGYYPTYINCGKPIEQLEKYEQLKQLEQLEKYEQVKQIEQLEKYEQVKQLEKMEKYEQLEKFVQLKELEHLEKYEQLKQLEQLEKIQAEKKFIGQLEGKKWLREELLEQEPRFVEKKWLRELLEEPKFSVEKKQLIRELLEQQPRLIEKQLVRELLMEQEPRFVEKKLIEKKLAEKKLVRELLLEQEPRHIEKKIREILLQGEPRLIEKECRQQMYREELLNTNNVVMTPVVFKYPIDLTSPIVEAELLGHKIEERVVYPTSGYLHMIWKSLAKLHGVMEIEQLPVVFEKVEFHRPTIMMVRGTPVKKIVEFKVKIVPTTGLFEIVEDEKIIVTGRVKALLPTMTVNKRVVEKQMLFAQQPFLTSEFLRREEIYAELSRKGYEYESEELKPIIQADLKCAYGEMLWTGKWVSFLEGLIQMKTLAKRRTTQGIMIPRRITKLVIDPIVHMELVEKKQYNMINSITGCNKTTIKYVLPVVYDRRIKKTVVGGIELVELKTMTVPRIEKIERELLSFPVMPITKMMTTLTTGNNATFYPTIFNNQEEELFVQEQLEEKIVEEELLHKVKREFVQYYVEECKRIAEYIVKKIECPMTVRGLPLVQTPLPTIVKHLIEKIKYERKSYEHEPIVTVLLQGGHFLNLLKQIVEEIHLVKEEQCIRRRVKCVLIENMYKTLEKDIIFGQYGNVKSHFVQLFKTILVEKIEQPELMTPRAWTRVQEPRFFDLEQRLRMIQEPRIVRSPSAEFVFPRYL